MAGCVVKETPGHRLKLRLPNARWAPMSRFLLKRIRVFILGMTLLIAFVTFRGLVQAQATTFTVNSADDVDDGTCDATHCSLREAINAANANSGTDSVAFNVAGSGPHTIQHTSALPTITDPVIIDGYTQTSASPNTKPPGPGPEHRAQDRAGRDERGGRYAWSEDQRWWQYRSRAGDQSL